MRDKDFYMEQDIDESGVANTTPDNSDDNEIIQLTRGTYTPTVDYTPNNLGNIIDHSDLDAGMGNVTDFLQAGNEVGNFRQDNQGSLEVLGNTLTNFVTIGAGVAVNNTAGLVVGMTEALFTGEVNRLWNNSVTNSVNALQNNILENNVNYRGSQYEDASIGGKMLQGVFWADLFQNLGYVAGMAVTAPLPAAGFKAIAGAAKMGQKAGALMTHIGTSTFSALGEAASMAVDTKNTKTAEDIEKVSINYRKLFAEANNRAEQLELQESFGQTVNEITEDNIKAGNFTYGYNMAMLSLSNSLGLGRYLTGGYKTGKNLASFVKKVNNAPTMKNKALVVTKASAVKLKDAVIEGLEEVSQGAITDATYKKSNFNRFTESVFNTEKREITDNSIRALGKSFAEAMNDPETAVEFTMGALTGFMGVPKLKKSIIPVGLEGNIVSEIYEGIKEYKEASTLVDKINDRLAEDPNLNTLFDGIVRHQVLEDEAQEALHKNDKFEFENSKTASLLNDIIMFDKVGMLDNYKNFADLLDNATDEEIQQLITETTKEGGIGPYTKDGKPLSIEEARKKLQKNKNEILTAIDDYSKSKEFFNSRYPNLQEENLAHVLYLNRQIKDWDNRSNSLFSSFKDINIPTIDIKEGTDEIEKSKIEIANTLINALATDSQKDVLDILKDTQSEVLMEVLDTIEENYKTQNGDPIEFHKFITDFADYYKMKVNSGYYVKTLNEYLEQPSKISKNVNKIKNSAKEQYNKKENKKNLERIQTASDIELSKIVRNRETAKVFLNITKDNKELHDKVQKAINYNKRLSYAQNKVNNSDLDQSAKDLLMEVINTNFEDGKEDLLHISTADLANIAMEDESIDVDILKEGIDFIKDELDRTMEEIADYEQSDLISKEEVESTKQKLDEAGASLNTEMSEGEERQVSDINKSGETLSDLTNEKVDTEQLESMPESDGTTEASEIGSENINKESEIEIPSEIIPDERQENTPEEAPTFSTTPVSKSESKETVEETTEETVEVPIDTSNTINKENEDKATKAVEAIKNSENLNNRNRIYEGEKPIDRDKVIRTQTSEREFGYSKNPYWKVVFGNIAKIYAKFIGEDSIDINDENVVEKFLSEFKDAYYKEEYNDEDKIFNSLLRHAKVISYDRTVRKFFNSHPDGIGTFDRVNSGKVKAGDTIKFRIYNSVNAEAGSVVIFIVNSEEQIIGDLGVPFNFNAETWSMLAPTYNYIVEQYNSSTSSNSGSDGVFNIEIPNSKVDTVYIGTSDFTETGNKVNTINNDIRLGVAVSNREIISNPERKEGDTKTVEEKGIVSITPIQSGVGYILIPTAVPNRPIAVPIRMNTYDRTDGSQLASELFKILASNSVRLSEGKISVYQYANSIKSILNIPGLFIKKSPNFPNFIIKFTKSDGTLFEKWFNYNDSSFDETNAVNVVLNAMYGLSYNIDRKKINTRDYNNKIGEVSTVLLNTDTAYTSNNWFTVAIPQGDTKKVETASDTTIKNNTAPQDDATSEKNSVRRVMTREDLKLPKKLLNTFDRLNPLQQQTLLIKDDLTIIESLLETLHSTWSSKKKEFNIKKLEMSVDEFLEDNLYRIKTDKDKYKKIDLQKEFKWLAKVLPSLIHDNKVRIIKGLIKIANNEEAYGRFKQGIIEISESASSGTMYHEAFHYVSQVILSDKEREELYNTAKNKYGNLNNTALEEKLAEDFRKYVELGEIPIIGSIVRFYRSLKNLINELIGKDLIIDNLFYRINQGNIENSNIEMGSTEILKHHIIKNKYDNLSVDKKEYLESRNITKESFDEHSLFTKEILFKCMR